MQRAFEEKAFGKPTIVPRFFEHAKIDKALTAGYGMNIYSGKTYVEIKTSGRKDTTTREAREDDKTLFDVHYKKYTKDRQNPFPMEALSGYSKANLFILRDLNVTTVEELATYDGDLPLGSLKLMRHCAENMMEFMRQYSPPAFNDDKMEIPDEAIQTQRKILQAGQDIEPADSQEGNIGGGIQQIGVSLNEDGEITSINGRPVNEEKEVKKEVKKEEPQVINFY